MKLFNEIFNDAVRQYPNRVALSLNGQTLTYRQLDNAAKRMAYRFIGNARKIKKTPNLVSLEGLRIALVMPKCFEHFISLLAVWKAGGILVLSRPPEFDEDKNAWRSNQCQNTLHEADLIIAHTRFLSIFEQNEYFKSILFHADTESFFDLNGFPKFHKTIRVDPASDAYIVYTSGTTGIPKGAINIHEGLESRIEGHKKVLGLNESSVVAQDRPLYIDASLQEITMTFAVGGRLEVIPEGLQDWQEYVEYFNSYGITHAILVPSILKQIATQSKPDYKVFPHMENILTTGESMTVDIYDFFNKQGVEIVNGYGTAETSISATLWQYKKGEISIGEAMEGVETFILAPNTNKLTKEGEGELVLAGLGIGRGYTNNEELTKKRFRHFDPRTMVLVSKANQYTKPCYLTGDKVTCKKHENNYLHYIHGRIDDEQEKIHGNLISMEGVEKVLENLEINGGKIIDKAQVAKLNGQLVAGVRFFTGKRLGFDKIKEELEKQNLLYASNHMPVLWQEFKPEINNQWKDKLFHDLNDVASGFHFPISEIQTDSTHNTKTTTKNRVIQIWNNVLPSAKWITNVSFESAGGDSITVMNFSNRLRHEFSVNLMVAKLLKQSVDEVAQTIDSYLEPAPLIFLNENICKSHNESKTNTPVFFIHALLGKAENDYGRFSEFFKTREIYGVSVKDLGLVGSIDVYANLYKTAIQQKPGPYLLAGWSSGGVIAHRVAELLREDGHDVALFMLDSTSSYHLTAMSEEEHGDYAIKLATLTGKFIIRVIIADEGIKKSYTEKIKRISLSKDLTKSQQIDCAFRQLETIHKDFLNQIEISDHQHYAQVIRNAWSIALGVLAYQGRSCKNQQREAPDRMHDKGKGSFYCRLYYAKNENTNPSLGWEIDESQIKALSGTHLSIMKKEGNSGFTELVESLQAEFNRAQSLFQAGTVTPILSLPFRKNEFFVGRADFLDKLRSEFNNQETYGSLQLIAGPGGIGKTQLAIEYAHESARSGDYQLIWYLNMNTVDQDYAGLASVLRISNDLRKHELISQVNNKLSEYKRYLIIIDEVVQYNTVKEYFPAQGGHILLISRYSGILLNKPIEVNPFNEKESIAYIFKLLDGVKNYNEFDAKQLATLLGNFPLALTQACVYIKTSGNISISDYIHLFQTSHKEIWQQESPLMDYQHTVATVFTLTIQKLEEESSEALALLYEMAYLEPSRIPWNLITRPLNINDVLILKYKKLLLKYVIVQVHDDNQLLSMHPLMQLFIRDRIEKNGQIQHYIEKSLIAITHGADKLIDFTINPNEYTEEPISLENHRHVALQCRDLTPHLQSVLKHAEDLHLEINRHVYYYFVLGTSYYYLADLNKSTQMILRAKELKSNPDKELADIYHALTIFSLSLPSDPRQLDNAEKSLELSNHFYGENSERSQEANAILGEIIIRSHPNEHNLVHRGIQYFEKALNISNQLNQEHHFFTHRIIHMLIAACDIVGEIEKLNYYMEISRRERARFSINQPSAYVSIEQIEQDYQKFSEIHDETHPLMTRLLYDLSCGYLDAGRYEDALKINLKRKAIVARTHGTNSIEYAGCLHNIATIYFERSRLTEVITLCDEIINIYEKTAIPLSLIKGTYLLKADCYADQRNFNDAILYYRKALLIVLEHASSNCFEIGIISSDLAHCYSSIRNYRMSLHYYLKSGRIAMQYNPSRLSPHKADILFGIGNSAFHLNRFEIALFAYKKLIEHGSHIRDLDPRLKVARHRIAFIKSCLIHHQNITSTTRPWRPSQNIHHHKKRVVHLYHPKEEGTHKIESNDALRGLSYQKVPGDGHCLFHAVGLYLDQDAAFLRRIISAHMEYNFDDFKLYREGTDEDFRKYIENIRNGTEWGDHIEIEIIQRITNRAIIIIRPDASPTIPDNLMQYRESPIFLYYNDHNHYDAFTIQEGYDPRIILTTIQTQIAQGKIVNYHPDLTQVNEYFLKMTKQPN